MEMLEKRQQSELKLIKEQSRQDIDALQKQIEIVNDSGMKVQKDLETQMEGAIERERETDKALQAMKLLSDQKEANFHASVKAMNEEIQETRGATQRSFEELFKQINLNAKTEGQTIHVLNNTIQLLDEHRKDAAAMRDEIRDLRDQLGKAQNPGFFSWVIRTLF